MDCSVLKIKASIREVACSGVFMGNLLPRPAPYIT